MSGSVDGVSGARRAKRVETKSCAPREFEDDGVGNWDSDCEWGGVDGRCARSAREAGSRATRAAKNIRSVSRIYGGALGP